MGRSAVQNLVAARQDTSRLHRMVVRVGAAAAWVASVIFLTAGAVTGDRALFVEAVGPVLAASLMTIQILVHREDGGVALFGSGLIAAVWYPSFGGTGSVIPAAVALVLVSSLGMFFVDRHRIPIAVTLAGTLGFMPFLWPMDVSQQVFLGVVMGVSFVMTFIVMDLVNTNTISIQARYQLLFAASPTAVLEEDWSEALDYVRSEYTGKPDRIKHFLLAYPAVVRRAVGLARVLRANDAAIDLLQISHSARFLGYRDPDVITDDNMASFVNALVALYRGERTWEHEVPTRTRSGELLWLHSRAVDTSTSVPGGSIVIALADITSMKARNQAMAELVRAKDEFIANVSHELRTPLTAVIGISSELVESETIDPADRRELLQLVASQAGEMANIVDDLLVAARAEIGSVSVEMQEVDLVAEVRATLDGLGLEVELPRTAPPFVMADPRRVRQILRNLLTNAQRYGGPTVRIAVGRLRDSVWLEVRDNGVGVPDDEASRIFEPYVTGSSKVQSSVGLGLAVARQLAELMGGTLRYERSAAETVFRLELPSAVGHQRVLASRSEFE